MIGRAICLSVLAWISCAGPSPHGRLPARHDAPTTEQCRQAIANHHRLVRFGDPDPIRDRQMMSRCRAEGTVAEVECVAAANTVSELEDCQAP